MPEVADVCHALCGVNTTVNKLTFVLFLVVVAFLSLSLSLGDKPTPFGFLRPS